MRIRSGAVWTRRNWIRSGFDPDRMCSVEGPFKAVKTRVPHSIIQVLMTDDGKW